MTESHIPSPNSIEYRAYCVKRTRAIRSLCYRLQQDASYEPADSWEKQMQFLVEKLPGFDGWANFGETWNLDRDKMLKDAEYLEITSLMFSIAESWEAEVRKGARELNPKTPSTLQLP